ncbi:hypothetical protein TEA_001618 [Camellia sinensis var. sinensis]|uniref:PB1 domain-containing protein n=1 Tax=Camellia sinensis var. sinensis TaxID=542762 RepID=A0A4S4ESY2_CAMSN|nr:hypothetical protein TEA_001618 [Camellia sinensis var. sinensis]
MAVAQLPSLYVQSATKISIQSSKTFNQSPFAAMSSTSSGQSLLYSHIIVIFSQLFTSIDYYLRMIFNLMCFFDKPSRQQCIKYCSNAKKKRCPVCKQAFSEANVSRLYFQSVGNLYQKLINCEDNPGELHREIDHSQQEHRNKVNWYNIEKYLLKMSCKELTAKCNVLGRGEARALRKLGKAKEKIKKLKARIQELKTAVEVKDNEVLRALKASKKTILEEDVLNDVDWNSNSSSISEDLAVEKNYFSRSEAASDTRSEVHRPCNKNGVSSSKSAFWTNEDWEVMTRNPIFVLFDTLAVEALQKMVLGKFRHLTIVESGEVIALLDIAKCLYDAIARMERAAEKGKAIAAVVEGVEKQWGASIAGPNTFIETLRDRMFRPFLFTVIPENSKIATVSPTDTVLMVTKKMVEYGMSSAVVAVENKTRGILTSKDILMRVIAQNLPPESTPVEKVMTPNPECATVDTPIVNALHIMHDGKFLHLPVVDKDGVAVAVVDVLYHSCCYSHSKSSIFLGPSIVLHEFEVGSNVGVSNDSSPNMMQKFWDSAMALSPDEEEDAESDSSFKLASESIKTTRSLPYPSSIVPNTFAFKIQDKKGRMHRFNCDTRSLTDLVTAILQRVGDEIDHNNLPHILYEDEDHDNVVLASDSDLAAAVDHARTQGHRRGSQFGGVEYAQSDVWASAYSALAAGAALIAGLSMLAYLRRNGN